MKVGYDRQIFEMQSYGGISRYFASLIDGIDKLSGKCSIRADLLFHWHCNVYLKEVRPSKKYIDSRVVKVTRKFWKRDWTASYRLYSQKPSIVHATFYNGNPSIYRGVPLVCTLYDMAPEVLPHFFRGIRPHANKMQWLEAADLIISISKSSADSLCEIHPQLEKKIVVSHLSASMGSDVDKSAVPFNRPFFLYVGARYGYKNFKMLLDAFKKSLELSREKDMVLCCVGGSSFKSDELELINRYRLTRHVKRISADDGLLSTLYRGARAVVVPSLFEGFSIPLVEALVCNTPVVCSDIGVHREVASDFATLIGASDIDMWANVMAESHSLNRPRDIVGSGYRELCRHYSTERMAVDHINAYQTVAE